MQKLPAFEGASGIENLAYTDLNIDLPKHIARFQEITPFKTLHILVSDYLLEAIPELTEYLKKATEEKAVKLKIIAVTDNIDASIKQLNGAEAAYLGPLARLGPDNFKKLVAKINDLKIPTLSMMGRTSVEAGVYACIAMDIDTQKLARRIALNVQRIILGEDPGEFQTSFAQVERLTINMETARKIGVYPTFEQMTDAELVNEDVKNIERKLCIKDVISKAVVRSLQLAAKNQELSAGKQSIERAKARLRPQLSIFGQEVVMDKDRADSMMSPAEYTTKIGADLMQVIYSEQANAGIDIQKFMLAAKKEEERALILDVIRDAAIAYLNVLKTKTLMAIQRDNLEVTRANLEIARFREQVGISGPAEVYRWEIMMTNARQAIIDASAMRKKSELMLNQLLNAGQEEEFATSDDNIFSRVFVLDPEKISTYLDNVHGYKVFRDFMVMDTFAFSPELQQINNGLKAQKRMHKSAKRRFDSPTVALQGNFSRTIKENGVGDTKPSLPAPFSSILKVPDKNDWYVGLNVSIPIHEGGDRRAAIKEADAGVKKLENDREFLKQRLELNTRVTLEDARASYSSIKLAETRADYASKTLELVQSAYTRGAVNILDLIDAQNASLVAKEASANAIFNFLSDFIKVCRAVGSFDFMLKEESHRAWYERLESFYSRKD